MNLGPNTVSLTYQYVLNQSGNNPITLGSGQAVNWDASNIVTKTGSQVISGSKTFNNTLICLQSLLVSGSSIISSYNSHTSDNQIGIESSSNNFGGDSYSNIFGDISTSNSFGSSATLNYFGVDASYNYFGSKQENSINNYFGDNAESNTFGYGANINIFGTSGSYNYFGNSCPYGNFFGTSAANNAFGDSANANTFGNNCPVNQFSCYISSSSIENYFAIQDGLENGIGSIKNEFGGIFFGQTNENNLQIINRFGNLAKENYFGYNYYSGSSVSDDTLNYFGGNSHGNYFGENTISGNYFGRSSNNYFGNTQSTNYFGGSGSTNYFYGGQFLNEAKLLLAQFAGARSQSGQLGELRISGSGLYVCTGATGGWGRTFLLSNF